jgi:transposase-like protein
VPRIEGGLECHSVSLAYLSLNRQRRLTCQCHEAASKLLFLVLRNVSQNWKMPPCEWSAARTQFAVVFGDRFVEP